MNSLEGTPAPSMRERAATRSDEAGCSEGFMDTAIPAETPTETAADRCYRNLIIDAHGLLERMRKGEAPDQGGIYPTMVPWMLRDIADRLDAVRPA